MLRVDLIIIISPDNHSTMTVIQEVFQSVIKAMKRNDSPGLLIHQRHGRFFKECQHRTLAFRQMFSGSAMGPDRSKHTCQQIKLVGDKGIDFLKIFCISIQLFLYSVIEHDQIFNNSCLLPVKQPQALGCHICFIQNSFLNNRIYIGRR